MRFLLPWLCFTVIAALGMAGPMYVVQPVVADQKATVTVNIGINYGNGTIQWHNGTVVASGQFLLNATMKVASVEFTIYTGPYFVGPGLPGAFVTGINGVRQKPAANRYWMCWVYNPQTKQYDMLQVGAGSYALTSDQTVQWYYENTGSMTNPVLLPPYTSVSLNVRVDSSSVAVISGSIHPKPSGSVNVTLEFSNNQGATYQEIARIVSAVDGTFSYSWKVPSSGVFLIRADAQGVKSSPVSIATSPITGFPFESLVAGSAMGVFLTILGRKLHPRFRSSHG